MEIPRTGVILFSASWAGEASASARQILEAACRPDGFVEFEENSETEAIFDAMNIEAVPCVVRMSEGKEVDRVIGADSKSILSLLKKSSTSTSTSSSVANDSPTILPSNNGRDLKQLVERSKLMLFIKGTPVEPRCGFTSQLIRLLTENGLEWRSHYETFNILEDQGVREALKVWAQWPTYPQIYWKGELLGGLDILKEMFASGQMDEIVSELKQ